MNLGDFRSISRLAVGVGLLVSVSACTPNYNGKFSPAAKIRARVPSLDPETEVIANPPDKTPDPSNPVVPPTATKLSSEDFLQGLPTGADQLKNICARLGNDVIRQKFCNGNPPTVNSLVTLQAALGLSFVDPAGSNASNGNPGFVLTGHSTSLVTRNTSAINPRSIVFTPYKNNTQLNALGFVRGEQLAEIISRDTAGNMSFFLVAFKQACNSKPEKCSLGDLLTPSVEKDWVSYSIYEDVDLKNTVVDCLQCHQAGGTGTPKIFRMQERVNPWTHFFRANRPGGKALLDDFHAAHGTTEDYGGIPATMIDKSDPRKLEDLVEDSGFTLQPNEFLTSKIEGEVTKSSPSQPVDNSVPGTSATWESLYANAVLGTTIPVPYHDVKVTDPVKLASFTSAYKSVMTGTLPVNQMPDIRNIFPDNKLRDLGFQVKAGLNAQGILIQACTQCHNAKLDQSISRANFNVDLSKMSRVEKDIAILRIQKEADSLFLMPPRRFRGLTDDEKKALIDLLKQ